MASKKMNDAPDTNTYTIFEMHSVTYIKFFNIRGEN